MTTTTCDQCKLEFSRHTLERHLARGHRLDLCRLCSKPVLTYQVTPIGATLDFCSGACVAEVRRRRLCFRCFDAYTPDMEAYFCRACSKELGRRIDPFGGIYLLEGAIEQSRWLPSVYTRNDPNAWKLDFIRMEDVA